MSQTHPRARRLSRGWKALAAAVLLQAPGCWCDPVVPEKFNPFPAALAGDAEAFCSAYGPAHCQFLQRCDPAQYQGLQAAGGCSAAAQAICEQERATLLAAHALGRASYDAVLARGCVDDESARACTDPTPAACGSVLVGALTQDAPCEDDAECAEGLFCSGGPFSCGLCVSRSGPGGPCWGAQSCQSTLLCKEGLCTRPLVLGSACAAGQGTCPTGTVCFPPFVPFALCTSLATEGASCGAFSPCNTGLVCVASDAGSACQGPAQQGGPCDPLGLTAPTCSGEGVRLFCNATDNTCAAVVVVAAGGACEPGRVCPSHQACQSGTCRSRPITGQECTVDQGVDPCFLSTCQRGICTAPARAGEGCDGGCPGLTCVNGACGKEPCDGGQAWDAWVPDAAPVGGADAGPGDAGTMDARG